MQSASRSRNTSFTIRGTDGGVQHLVWFLLGAMIIVCSVMAWYMPYSLLILIPLFICGITILRIITLYRRRFEIHIDPVYIQYKTWTRQERIPLAALAALSLRATLAGRRLKQTIVCWDERQHEIGYLPTQPFRKTDTQALLNALRNRIPQIQIERELQHFVEQPDSR